MNDNNVNELKDSLPNLPGIMGKDEYFNSAVLIPLVLINGEYHFLLECRAEGIKQGGEICFPGGAYDLSDDNCQETAIRETVEELGIKRNQIEIIGRLDTFISSMRVTVEPFIGILELNSLDELKINDAEVSRVFALPISYFEEVSPKEYQVRLKAESAYINETGEKIILLPAEELNLPDRYLQSWGGVKYNVYLYKTDEGVIWGITARLIFEFIQKLRG